MWNNRNVDGVWCGVLGMSRFTCSCLPSLAQISLGIPITVGDQMTYLLSFDHSRRTLVESTLQVLHLLPRSHCLVCPMGCPYTSVHHRLCLYLVSRVCEGNLRSVRDSIWAPGMPKATRWPSAVVINAPYTCQRRELRDIPFQLTASFALVSLVSM